MITSNQTNNFNIGFINNKTDITKNEMNINQRIMAINKNNINYPSSNSFDKKRESQVKGLLDVFSKETRCSYEINGKGKVVITIHREIDLQYLDKFFSQISDQDYRIDIFGWNSSAPWITEFAKRHGKKINKLRYMGYNQSVYISKAELNKLLSHTPNLTDLWLPSFNRLFSKKKDLEVLDLYLPNLTSLRCWSSNFGEIKLSHPKKIKELKLDSCRKTNEEDLYQFSNLENLEINHMTLASIDLSVYKKLKKVQLSSINKLQSLNLSGLNSLNRATIERCRELENVNLELLTNLLRISLEGCNKIQALDLSSSKNLESVNIEGCYDLTELKIGNLINPPKLLFGVDYRKPSPAFVKLVTSHLMYQLGVSDIQSIEKFCRSHNFTSDDKTQIERIVNFCFSNKEMTAEDRLLLHKFIINHHSFVTDKNSYLDNETLHRIYSMSFLDGFDELDYFIKELSVYKEEEIVNDVYDFFADKFFISSEPSNKEFFTSFIKKYRGKNKNDGKNKLILSMLVLQLYSSLNVDKLNSGQIQTIAPSIDSTLNKIFFNKKVSKDMNWISSINNFLYSMMKCTVLSNKEKTQLVDNILSGLGDSVNTKKAELRRRADLLRSIADLHLFAKVKDLCVSPLGDIEITDYLEKVLVDHVMARFNISRGNQDCSAGTRYITSFREPKAIFSYLASLTKISDVERRNKALASYKYYLTSLLTGDFKTERYNDKKNEHLNFISKSYPRVFDSWKKGLSVEASGYKELISQLEFLKVFKEKLFHQNHLDKNWKQEYPMLIEALESNSGETAAILKEIVTIAQMLAKLNFLEMDKQKKDQLITQAQKQIKQLCDQSSTKSKKEILLLFKEIIKLLANNVELKNDMQALLTMSNPIKGLNRFTVIETDDPEDLLMCGTDVEGSCQKVDAEGGYNIGLLGYIWNGQTRMVAVKNQQGKIVARRMERLLLDCNNQPQMFMERVYGDPKYSELLKRMCQQKAEELQLNLYSHENVPEGGLHSLGGPSPFEYIDYQGVIENGKYHIN